MITLIKSILTCELLPALDNKPIDIIFLQEVFSSIYSSKWKNSIIDVVNQHNNTTIHTGIGSMWYVSCSPIPKPCPHLLLMDSGLMTLSRYPIVNTQFEAFISNPLPLRFAQKGFLYTCINMNNNNNTIYHLFNTHLHPLEGSWTIQHSNETRSQQCIQLKQFIDTNIRVIDHYHHYRKSEVITAVVGDFNIHQNSFECNVMKQTLQLHKQCTIPLDEPTMHLQHLFCTHHSLLSADFAIGSDNCTFENTRIMSEYPHLSDHFPVLFSISAVK